MNTAGGGSDEDGAAVQAAGAVVLRSPPDGTGEGPQVLTVHRPRYDDWSLPKGKLEPGEAALVAAVRELVEETGVRPLPGRRLPRTGYRLADGRRKTVQWWLAGIGAQAAREPDDEVDELRWTALSDTDALSMSTDRELLAAVRGILAHGVGGPDAGPPTVPAPPLMLLRHGSAVRRKRFGGPEQVRPLDAEGEEQAGAVVPLLTAFAPATVLVSTALRCRQTVQPFLGTAPHVRVWESDDLTEQAVEQDPTRVDRVLAVARAARADGAVLICTHRPVLRRLFDRVVGTPGPGAQASPLGTAEVAVVTGPDARPSLDRYLPPTP